jgi:hypothetical protein
MAVKTFTSGETLTASDTNTYLNNGGLVYINSTTFSGASSVGFSNIFTSTYDNYRILFVLSGNSSGGLGRFRLSVGGVDRSAGSYFMTGYSNTWNTTLTSYNAGSQTLFEPVGLWSSSIPSGCAMDIYGPAQATINTNWSARVNDAGGGGAYVRDCVYAVTEAQDGFTVFPSALQISGTITVYGYRKA